LSNRDIDYVDWIQFCWEGLYNSTGGSSSAKLLWYNVTSGTWVADQSISTTESVYCKNFTSNAKVKEFYNSTSKLVQFAVMGNQSKTGHVLTVYADFANLTMNPGGWLNVTLLSPNPSTYNNFNPYMVNRYNTFWVNATVECKDGNCGNIFGTVRYNASSANPDTHIKTIEGATPFYDTSGIINKTIATSASGSSGDVTSKINASDDIRASEFCGAEESGSCDSPYIYIDFKINEPYEYVTLEGYGDWSSTYWWGGSADFECSNSAGGWQSLNPPQLGDIDVNVTSPLSNCDNSDGSYNFRVRCSAWANKIGYYCLVYVDYIWLTRDWNRVSCGILNEHQTCNVSWRVNATGLLGNPNVWNIDANFESDSFNISSNDTENAVVKIETPTVENNTEVSTSSTSYVTLKKLTINKIGESWIKSEHQIRSASTKGQPAYVKIMSTSDPNIYCENTTTDTNYTTFYCKLDISSLPDGNQQFELQMKRDSGSGYTVYNKNWKLYLENIPPRYYRVETNATGNIFVGDYVKHRAEWRDNSGLYNYTFSWNATGPSCSQGWQSVSSGSLIGTYNWSEVTLMIPSGCSGKVIGWRFYAKDITGKENVTSIQTYPVYQYGILEVNLTDPYPKIFNESNPKPIPLNDSFNVTATVTCGGGPGSSCAEITGGVRYNTSIGMTLVNTTEGVKPMFVAGGPETEVNNPPFYYDDGWYFDIGSERGTQSVMDMEYNGTYFWIILFNGTLLRYNSNGNYDNWSVNLVNGGITDTSWDCLDFNGTNFFACGNTNDEVYVFNSAGTYTGFHFDLAADGCTNPTAIVFNGTYYWVLTSESGDDKVYKFNSYGGYIDSWTADAGNPGQEVANNGMDFDGTYFYISDMLSSPHKVYRYTDTGGNTYWNFTTDPTQTIVYGLQRSNWDGGKYFWGLDYTDKQVRRYAHNTTPGAENPISLGTLNYGDLKQVNFTINVTGNPMEVYTIDVNFSSSSPQVQKNNTDYAVIMIIEETPPTYSNDGDNSTGYTSLIEGYPVLTYVYWNDNTELYKAELKTNKTGSMQNEATYYFTSTPQWANLTIDTTKQGGKRICWVQHAYDIFNVVNDTMGNDVHCFDVLPDTEPPRWIEGTNSTSSTDAGTPVKFSLKWQDNIGLSGYILSLDNCTGSFKNETWNNTGWDSTEEWSNVTGVINSTKCMIRWMYFVNDTNDKWNASDVFSFESKAPWGVVTLLKPDPSECSETSPCLWKQYKNYEINATMTCRWNDCGDVQGVARYKVEKTYDFNGITNPSSTHWAGDNKTFLNKLPYPDNYTEALNVSYNKIDDSDNDRWSTKSVYPSTDRPVQMFKFKLDESADEIEKIFILWEGFGSGVFPVENLYLWNLSSSSWVYINGTGGGGTEKNYTYTINSSFSDFVDTSNYIRIAALGPPSGEDFSGKPKDGVIYTDYVAVTTSFWRKINTTEGMTPFYTTDSNPQACGSLTGDHKCQLNWTVNATGILHSIQEIDVKFYSDINANDTENAFINITWFNEPPQWSQMATSPPSGAVYQTGRNYGFQIKWTDPESGPAGISTVIFEWDNETTKYNYTTPSVKNDTTGLYWINLTDLSAGDYNFTWYANDTDGFDASKSWPYKINQASASIHLFLNGTEGNKYYENNTLANFTVTLDVPGKTVYLDTNITGWITQYDTTPLYNYTTLIASGYGIVYNITGYFKGDRNYSANYSTHYVKILESVPILGWLNVTLINPDPFIYNQTNPKLVLQNDNFVINASVRCEGDLGAVCGNVMGSARYDSNLISDNLNEKPFYIVGKTIVYDFDGITSPSSTNWAGDCGVYCGENPPTNWYEASTQEYGYLYASDDQRYTVSSGPAGYPVIKYAWERFDFKLNESVLNISNIHVLWEGNGSGYNSGSNLYISNFTTSYWEQINSSTSFGDTNLTRVFSGTEINNIINPSGYVWVIARARGPASVDEGVESIISTDYISLEVILKENPASCGPLNKSDTCQLNWTVKATGLENNPNVWDIDVNFNSDEWGIYDNNTDDATLKIYETQFPRWFDNSTDSTDAGKPVKFSLRWTDNFALSGYIFSFDNGTLDWTTPITVTSKSGEFFPNVANNTVDDDENTYWRDTTYQEHWITYDMGQSRKITKVRVLTNPSVDYNLCNISAVYISDDPNSWGTSLGSCALSGSSKQWYECDHTDKIGRYVNISILTTLSGSGCGEWGLDGFYEFDAYVDFINESWFEWSGQPSEAWSNVTKVITSDVGKIVKWIVFANDTSNNWNMSDVFSFNTTQPPTQPPSVTYVHFNVSSFYYNDPIECIGTVTDEDNDIAHVYYKLWDDESNENYPNYEGELNLVNNCVGTSWQDGKTCTAVISSVQGSKGYWNCSISANDNVYDNVTGYASTSALMINHKPSKPTIVEPMNETQLNKYSLHSINISCINTTLKDLDPEDIVTYNISWSHFAMGGTWTSICAGDVDGNCTWDWWQEADSNVYIKCNLWDRTDYSDPSDLIYIKIDKTDPTCILSNPENSQILESPYTLNGTYIDGSGISNVTYKFYNTTIADWQEIGTNYTSPYTYEWYVPDILEDETNLTLMAVCVDNLGNDANDTKTGIVVDLYNQSPNIWNLTVRNENDVEIEKTITGRIVIITVNASDADSARNISYIEGNFTWPNGTIDYGNFSKSPMDKPYMYNWTYAIHPNMPNGTASINVTVYDKFGLSNSTNTSLIIQPTKELDIENDTFINFSMVKPGQEVNAVENQGWPLKVIVGGNTPLNISQNGSEYLVGVVNPWIRIYIRNITWNQSDLGTFSSLTTNFVRVNDSLGPGESQPIYYKLSVPTVERQNYGGEITIKGEETT